MNDPMNDLKAGDGELVFAAGGQRVYRVPLSEIESVLWKRGSLASRLILRTRTEEHSFLIFGSGDVRVWSPPVRRRVRETTPSCFFRSPALPVGIRQHAAPPPAAKAIAVCCLRGPIAGVVIPVPKEGLLIGRNPRSAQLIVGAPEVSACHLRVTQDPSRSGVWIEDLNSKNGTYYHAGSRSWQRITERKRLGLEERFRLSPSPVEFVVTSA